MFCCWGEQYIVKTAHVLFFCIFNNIGLNIQMSYFFSLILNTDYVIAANMEYRCILMTSWRGVNQYVLCIWIHQCCFALLSTLSSGNLQEVCKAVDSPPLAANKASYDSFCYECLIYEGFVIVKLPSRQKSDFKKLWHHNVCFGLCIWLKRRHLASAI